MGLVAVWVARRITGFLESDHSQVFISTMSRTLDGYRTAQSRPIEPPKSWPTTVTSVTPNDSTSASSRSVWAAGR